MLPNEYAALDTFEKAAVIAFIDMKIKNDKEKEKEIKERRR